MKRFAALALVLFLSACGGPGPDAGRLDALEAEVRTLKEEAGARDKAFREELAQVRRNLDAIRALLESGQGGDTEREGAVPGAAPSDEELDAKAKSFVSENLDRLMALTRKLLDKMESELDNKPREAGEPPAKGDEI